MCTCSLEFCCNVEFYRPMHNTDPDFLIVLTCLVSPWTQTDAMSTDDDDNDNVDDDCILFEQRLANTDELAGLLKCNSDTESEGF